MEKRSTTNKTGKIRVSTKAKRNVKEYQRYRNEAYVHFAPGDFETIKRTSQWLREPGHSITFVVKRLSKRLPKLKEILVRSSIESVLNDLETIQKQLDNIIKKFNANIDGSKKLFNQLKTDATLGNPSANNALLILSAEYGGPTRLRDQFDKRPELIPTGVKKNITADAIRRRIERCKKESTLASFVNRTNDKKKL